MKVKDFVTKFNNVKDKSDIDSFLNKHIIKNYVSYAEKLTHCKNIINICCYSSINEKKFFKMNSPMKEMLLQMTFLKCYTDIEIDPANIEEYDMLMESKLIGLLIGHIDKSEISLFSSILDMMINDEIMNTRDLVSFLENKIDTINMTLNSLLDVVDSEEIKKL